MEDKNEIHTTSMGVLYRGFEEEDMICDMSAPKKEGVRIRIDTNNLELVNKIKQLPKRRRIWIVFQTPIEFGYKTEDMKIIKILTKDEYMVLYKPYHEQNKKMMAENMRTLRKMSKYNISNT